MLASAITTVDVDGRRQEGDNDRESPDDDDEPDDGLTVSDQPSSCLCRLGFRTIDRILVDCTRGGIQHLRETSSLTNRLLGVHVV